MAAMIDAYRRATPLTKAVVAGGPTLLTVLALGIVGITFLYCSSSLTMHIIGTISLASGAGIAIIALSIVSFCGVNSSEEKDGEEMGHRTTEYATNLAHGQLLIWPFYTILIK